MQNLAIPEIKPAAAKAPAAVDSFVALVQKGIDAWNEAGKRLVVAIEKDPGFCAKVRAAHPEISKDMLVVFERIGRKQIYAPLLADNSVGARALLEMPYADQERYSKGMVPVVQDVKTGRITERRVSDLSRAEAKLVFGFGEVRDPKHQVAYLLEQKTGMKKAIDLPPAAPVKKNVTKLGCFKVVIEGSKLTLTPCTETYRAQQVRVTKPEKGPFEAEVLLYMML